MLCSFLRKYFLFRRNELFAYVDLQHNVDYVVAADFGGYFSIRQSRHSAKLYYQPHIFHTLTVFVTGSDNINSCGIDTAMTENISEFGNVLFYAVECSCEQVAQIMGKHLLRIYPCLIAKAFHFTPNVSSAHRLATSCYENSTRCNFLRCCIAEQFLLQFSDNKYRVCFAFK